MNLARVAKYLQDAAEAAGVPRRNIEIGADALERFPHSPGVVIYPLEGAISARGRRVAPISGDPTGVRRLLWGGRIDYAMEVRGRSFPETEALLDGILHYLKEQHLHDDNENHIDIPAGDARLEWRDPDGLLMRDHRVRLVIPAAAELYSDSERIRIDVDVEGELATELTFDLPPESIEGE
jgi:hypothetical protein